MGVADGSGGGVELGRPNPGHAGGPPPPGQYGHQAPHPPMAAPPPQGYPPQGYPGYPQPAPAYGMPAAPQPIPGVRILPPHVPPQPGQVITGYQLLEPETGCCKCDGMNMAGWLTIIILVILGIPCFAFIPCLLPECFDKMQRPIYGYPPHPIPTGAPPPGY